MYIKKKKKKEIKISTINITQSKLLIKFNRAKEERNNIIKKNIYIG